MQISKKLATLAVASAVIVSGFAVAQSAQAAVIPSSTITISPVSGTTTAPQFLSSLGTDQACPTGFRGASITSVVQGAIDFNISNARNPGLPNESNLVGFWGLDSHGQGVTPISINRVAVPTNDFVSNNTLAAANLADGNFELRVYCFATSQSLNAQKPSSPWFSLTLNKTGTNWSVVVAATPTTVSLTASATGNTVNLSATVRNPALATATTAVGNMLFFEGATQVATVPVALGVASAPPLTRVNGTYVYTAQFVSTDAVFAGSVSASGTVNVGGQSATSTITVAIPNNVGALTLTGVSTSVSLGTAALNVATNTLDASGTLNATVTDTRQLNFPAWSLTGQVGDFTKTGPAATLDGKFLGWTPSVTGSTALNSTAGAGVAPATVALGNGLKTSSAFANGAPSATGTVTSASAVLLLKAPTNTPAGAYTATLTVTLI